MKRIFAGFVISALLLSFTAFAEETGNDGDNSTEQQTENNNDSDNSGEENGGNSEDENGDNDNDSENSDNDGENGENSEDGENPEEPLAEIPDEEGFIPHSLIMSVLEREDPYVTLTQSTGSVISINSLFAIRESGKVISFQLENGVIVSINPALMTESMRSIDLNVELIPINQRAESEYYVSDGNGGLVPAPEDYWTEDGEDVDDDEEVFWADEEPVEDEENVSEDYIVERYIAPQEPLVEDEYTVVSYDVETGEVSTDRFVYVPKYDHKHTTIVDREKGVGTICENIVIETGEISSREIFWKSNIIFITMAEQGDFGFTLDIHVPENLFSQANTDGNKLVNPLQDAPEGSYIFDRNTLTASISFGAYYYIDYEGDDAEWAEDGDAFDYESDESEDMMVMAVFGESASETNNPDTGENALPITAAIFAASAAVLTFKKGKNKR